jgi:Asp-tRNA(Asn)/Glu-tRNA(Gln) amidotransferase A subunit family amidase
VATANIKGSDPSTWRSYEKACSGQFPIVKGSDPLTFAACESLGTLDDDVRAAFHEVLEQVPHTFDSPNLPNSAATWSAIATAEARWVDAEAFASPALGPYAREFLQAGDAVTAEAYIRAQMHREEIHRAYAQLFERSGLLLTPTVGCEAFDGALAAPPSVPDWGAYLFDANLAGRPACAIRMGRGDDGLPVSLQIIGPSGADGAVLAAAQHMEEVFHVARYV